VAAGRDPDAVRRAGSRSPLAFLRSLTTPDGSVRYSRTSAQTPVWVTGQALAALQRRALPLAPVPRRPRGRAASAAAAAPGTTKAGAKAGATGGAAGPTTPVPLPVLAMAHEAGLAAAWLLAPVI
jgi:energy-coupling factor transport system substrate-specific component